MNKTLFNFKNHNKGFSLVELIVVIAIMAIMAAVLAPSLLGYVEKSRMQKDSSAMDEVTNAITLSLADQDVYDELLLYTVNDNYSCYADGDTTTNIDDNKVLLKAPDRWLYNDNARLLDETVYVPSGKMRGVTITFKPNGNAEYVLKDGIVNKIGGNTTAKGAQAGKTLIDTSLEAVYNKLRSTVGDTIKVSSQTYRNSDYTIFISMGTTGGNQADKQDAIKVWGQYNGTNHNGVIGADNITGGQQDGAPFDNQGTSPFVDYEIHNNVIPDNATYTLANGTVLLPGDNFPTTPQYLDAYRYGDYTYVYSASYLSEPYTAPFNDQFKNANFDGWLVTVRTETANPNANGWGYYCYQLMKESYGTILGEIAGKKVTNMEYAFWSFYHMKTAPSIPSTITNMGSAFAMSSCAAGESKLTTACKIPASVTNLLGTFSGCVSLQGTIEIDANPTSYDRFLEDPYSGYIDGVQAYDLTLIGNSDKLSELAKTSTPGSRIIYDQTGNILWQ